MQRFLTLSFCLTTCVAAACGEEEKSDNQGEEGERCLSIGTCNVGLECNAEDICVRASPCADVDCSGHGTCAVVEDAAVCICSAGFAPVGLTCLAANSRLGGLVVDAATGAPLAGVTVVVTVGGTLMAPLTTDAAGNFTGPGVPPGKHLLELTGPSGYLPAQAFFESQDDGDTITLGPLGLVPIGPPLEVHVLNHHCQPVEGFEVTVSTEFSWVDFSSGSPVPFQPVTGTAISGADGVIAVANLPDFLRIDPSLSDQVTLTLPPADGDGDGFQEYAGGEVSYNLRTQPVPIPDLILESSLPSELQIESSNLTSLLSSGLSVIAKDDPITIIFNLPIQPDASVTLRSEGGTVLNADDLTVAGNVLTFEPTLVSGAEYHLEINAVAAVDGPPRSGVFYTPFFTFPSDPITAVASTTPAGRIRITFSEPIGGGNAALCLQGSNCVLWFNFDQDASGTIGDYPSESGNPDCSATMMFFASEPDPPGPCGLSGYSTTWELSPPFGWPSGMGITIAFSHVPDPSAFVLRVSGERAPDFNLTAP